MYGLWVYFVFMCLTFLKDFEKHYVQIIIFGSIMVTVTLLVLMTSCISLAIVDFTLIFALFIRAIVTFMLFQLIRSDIAGFEEADLKPMHDSITYIFFPGLLLCTVNMKVELLASCPFAIVCTFLTYKSAFADEGENMTCYMQAEVTAQNLFTRTLILFLVVTFAIHDQRKTQIRHFIAQERAKKQQECLQSIFDKQPDGVLILSKPLDSAKTTATAKGSDINCQSMSTAGERRGPSG